MRVIDYNKIKKILISFLGISTSIGALISGLIITDGYKFTLFGAILLGLLFFTSYTILWSDWMYYYLINNGAKINYNTYQKLAIVFSIFGVLFFWTPFFIEVKVYHLFIILLLSYIIFMIIDNVILRRHKG